MKKEIAIASELVLDKLIPPTAKVIYTILKSFQTGKSVSGTESSVTISHREIMQRSGLSQKTVVKALSNLETAGWIRQQLNWGAASSYIFTIPKSDF